MALNQNPHCNTISGALVEPILHSLPIKASSQIYYISIVIPLLCVCEAIITAPIQLLWVIMYQLSGARLKSHFAHSLSFFWRPFSSPSIQTQMQYLFKYQSHAARGDKTLQALAVLFLAAQRAHIYIQPSLSQPRACFLFFIFFNLWLTPQSLCQIPGL